MVQVYQADQGGLPVGDRGQAYGDGLFETILAEGSQAALLSWHLDRLTRDSARLGIRVMRGELQTIALQALADFSEHYGLARWVLKLTLTRGAGGRGYQPSADMQPNLLVTHGPAPAKPPENGVRADFSPVPLTVNPLLSGIKTLNRLEQVMAAREMHGDLFELLMSNSDGQVVEGTRTNLFMLTGDGWLTPPSPTLAVAGVMRRVVLEQLRNAGESVTEVPLTLDLLMSDRCRGLYLTNSVLGVVPVRNLAGQDLSLDRPLATIFSPPTTME